MAAWMAISSSKLLEKEAQEQLLQDLALPGTRRNAAAPGKARLHSCCGRFASVWLTVCPTSSLLSLENSEFLVAMRRRLGIAISFDGADPMVAPVSFLTLDRA